MAPPAPRPVRLWLSAVFWMIVAMTMIGGTTRLTESGLSMVEWQPLLGALPPLGHQAWLNTFEKYQQTPQFQQVNSWMSLADFQRIFFWEYVHRLFGRSIGLVVGLPWLWFLLRRRMDRSLAWRTFLMLVLGGLQGLLGWYMVKSGLVDLPRVSHLRLAAHLLLAFGVAQYVLWVRRSLDPEPLGSTRAPASMQAALVGLIVLLFLQSAWGAFMAGTRAGLFADSFPDVHGHYLPTAFIGDEPLFTALVMNPGAIHATHRLLAWMLCLLLPAVAVWLWRQGPPQLRPPLLWLLGLLALQVVLGAVTVIAHVPIPVAVAHQGVALLMVSTCTATLERARRGGRAILPS